MSNSYSIEPPTQGKVVLKTTYGDLDIELWPNQAPLACRNFCQLIMEGYYNNTTFHRVIRNFMFQGGDPSGTGQLNPSDTIYGKLFKDEFHPRLKFKHRGLVGCANDNRPDSNGSMFFITLDRADHLNKQATIFGKVCGDTVHNLSRFNEVDTDADDRPEYPIHITEATVLISPFDDIVPRSSTGKMEAAEMKVVKSKVKNAALISFDDEDFEDEGFAIKRVEVKRPRVETEAAALEKKNKKNDKEMEEKRVDRLEAEVLLDYDEDNDDDKRDDRKDEVHQGTPPLPSKAGELASEPRGIADKRKTSKPKGVSLVQAAREQYTTKQKKYSSKKKKESDVLARIKQFNASAIGAKTGKGGSEMTETEKRDEGKSVLQQLDGLLRSKR